MLCALLSVALGGYFLDEPFPDVDDLALSFASNGSDHPTAIWQRTAPAAARAIPEHLARLELRFEDWREPAPPSDRERWREDARLEAALHALDSWLAALEAGDLPIEGSTESARDRDETGNGGSSDPLVVLLAAADAEFAMRRAERGVRLLLAALDLETRAVVRSAQLLKSRIDLESVARLESAFAQGIVATIEDPAILADLRTLDDAHTFFDRALRGAYFTLGRFVLDREEWDDWVPLEAQTFRLKRKRALRRLADRVRVAREDSFLRVTPPEEPSPSFVKAWLDPHGDLVVEEWCHALDEVRENVTEIRVRCHLLRVGTAITQHERRTGTRIESLDEIPETWIQEALNYPGQVTPLSYFSALRRIGTNFAVDPSSARLYTISLDVASPLRVETESSSDTERR